MLDWYTERNRYITRRTLKEVKAAQRLCDEQETMDAIAYFDRKGDLGLLRGMMKKRYAIQIRTEKATSDEQGVSQIGRQYYVKSDVADGIDLGMYELFNTGIGGELVRAQATLVTAKDQYFQYVNQDDESTSIEEVGDFINSVREAGRFSEHMEALDVCSVITEEVFFHVYFKGFEICYDVVLPSDMWIYYGTRVKELAPEGSGLGPIERAVDYHDLEDASAVVIRLAQRSSMGDGLTAGMDQYLAYIGACPEWPMGRMVTFWGTNPDPRSIYPRRSDLYSDYMRDGVVCNPLTWLMYSQQNREYAKAVSSEYPLVRWRGGNSMVGKTSSVRVNENSLYQTAMEIDLAFSNLLRYALAGARGKDVFEFPAGSSVTLPKSLDILVMTDGSTYRREGANAAEVLASKDILGFTLTTVANGYHVPGFMVLKSLVVPESGIALSIQCEPLLTHRDRRIKLNRDAMDEIFRLERALLISVFGDSAAQSCPIDVKQIWNPGTWSPPRDRMAYLEELKAERELEVSDHVDVVRKANGLATEQQALDMIEKWEDPERQAKGGYGTPAPQPESQPEQFGDQRDGQK